MKPSRKNPAETILLRNFLGSIFSVGGKGLVDVACQCPRLVVVVAGTVVGVYLKQLFLSPRLWVARLARKCSTTKCSIPMLREIPVEVYDFDVVWESRPNTAVRAGLFSMTRIRKIHSRVAFLHG